MDVEDIEASLSLLPTAPALSTFHWRMQVSFPPIERRWESLWVKHTLVTWLPWPSYLWLGACRRMYSEIPCFIKKKQKKNHYICCLCCVNLTLGLGQGYWKRWTLQKSSATATILSLWERHRALMSVPSDPSSHTPGHSQHAVSQVTLQSTRKSIGLVSYPWHGSPAHRCTRPILDLCSHIDSSTVYILLRCPLSKHIHL